MNNNKYSQGHSGSAVTTPGVIQPIHYFNHDTIVLQYSTVQYSKEYSRRVISTKTIQWTSSCVEGNSYRWCFQLFYSSKINDLGLKWMVGLLHKSMIGDWWCHFKRMALTDAHPAATLPSCVAGLLKDYLVFPFLLHIWYTFLSFMKRFTRKHTSKAPDFDRGLCGLLNLRKGDFYWFGEVCDGRFPYNFTSCTSLKHDLFTFYFVMMTVNTSELMTGQW